MEARDFETIEQFLKMVEKPDLFEYYGLGQDISDDGAEEAVKKRRSWAQGQQSNPKFRNEALWIIKHMSLLRRALVEEREAYWQEVQRKGLERSLEKLSVFIEGSLADGELTAAKEVAILEQATRLGVPGDRALERAQQILNGRTGPRGLDGPDGALGTFVDYYQILRVSADADAATIEEAHRARYREARDLADKARASEAYAQLDEGWRILSNADRRAAFDARRREYMINLERRAAGEDGEFKGFLPPPPKKRMVEIEPPKPAEPESTPDAEPMEVLLTQASRVVTEAPPARAAQPPRPPPGRPAAPSTPAPSITPAPASAPPLERVVLTPSAPTPTAPPAASSLSTPVIAHPSSTTAVPTPSARPDSQSGAYGSARQRQRAPQLEIDGPEVHKVRAGVDPVVVQFVVRNTGHGQMSGRVLSDREWVQVSPTRLDATRREQVVEAVIQPTQMPRRQAISLVTVVADHGERRSITIDVERKDVPVPVLIAVAVVGMILIAGIVLAFVV